MRTIKTQSISLGLHAAVLALGFLIGRRGILPPPPDHPIQKPAPLYFRPPRTAVAAASQRSGGASADETPARRGTPPPADRYFIPPEPRFEAKLPLPASVTFEAPLLKVSEPLGDPFSRVDSKSFGRGGRGGLGEDGCCGGIGPGQQGPPGLSARAMTAQTIPPKLIYKIEPEFSEEARKAKFQGTVILAIEVDESGRAINMRVLSSPGLGLDQKAIEAVAQWRFRPASEGGKPVASSARVEVNFHLL